MDINPHIKSNDAVLSREIAELDAQLNAKESFSKRVGLLPFTAGAVAAIVALAIVQLITHL